MGDRKLATVRAVDEIIPIEGADSIELARLGGWQVVCKKGEFVPGTYGLFFEVDSFLPEEDRFEFLRKSCYKILPDGSKGFRLKSIKLRGALSQGLLLPFNLFPEISSDLIEVGFDVTDLLNIKKWEAPVPANLSGLVKGNFPSWIPKTDAERIQNLSNWFDLHREVVFEESLKMDGSSMTVYFNDCGFGVCSRNIDLKEDDNNSFWKTANAYSLNDRLTSYGKNIALQGELIGEGIQKNREMLLGHEFRIFNIYLIDSGRYALPSERNEIITELNKLQGKPLVTVPIYREVKILQEHDMKSLLKHANGPSLFGKIREGLVYKSCELIKGQMINFKVINNEYLLKCEE